MKSSEMLVVGVTAIGLVIAVRLLRVKEPSRPLPEPLSSARRSTLRIASFRFSDLKQQFKDLENERGARDGAA